MIRLKYTLSAGFLVESFFHKLSCYLYSAIYLLCNIEKSLKTITHSPISLLQRFLAMLFNCFHLATNNFYAISRKSEKSALLTDYIDILAQGLCGTNISKIKIKYSPSLDTLSL